MMIVRRDIANMMRAANERRSGERWMLEIARFAAPVVTWTELVSTSLLLVSCALLATSCAHDCGRAPAVAEPSSLAPDISATNAPTTPSHPAIVHEVEDVTVGAVRYTLHRFRVPLSATRLELVDLAFERTLASTLEATDAALVINAGYWDSDNHPEGLAVSRGHRIAELLHTLGGGVLVVDESRARLLDVEADGFEAPADVDFAVQCMPRLVVDGVVNIRRDDGRLADRTALCIRDGGRTLDVVLAKTEEPTGHGGPSLYVFAERLVADGCEQALNLDGGGSTGAAYWEDDALAQVPPRTPLRLAIVFSPR